MFLQKLSRWIVIPVQSAWSLRVSFHVGRSPHQILVEMQFPPSGIYISTRKWWASSVHGN